MHKPIWEGDVVALYLAPAVDVEMQPVNEVRLVVGRGIEGDRHYLQNGAGSDDDDEEPSHEVTLIESEAIQAVSEETRKELDASAVRRNIVTRGFAVSHLVGQEFQIGAVRLRGLALYEPSPQLMEIVGHKIAVSLMHRGGLIAEIIVDGVIRVGDRIHA